MNSPSPSAKVLKALIAPARHSDGPTLYLICQDAATGRWEIHEHLPDGKCMVWNDPPLVSAQQAEAAIHNWGTDRAEPTM